MSNSYLSCLMDALNEWKIKGEEDEFAKGYNMAIRHAVGMIKLYDEYARHEIPKSRDLGENPYQE